MNLTKEELNKLHIPYNYILVRPSRQPGEILTNGGMKLFVDTTFEPQNHTPIDGDVIKVPDELVFNKNVYDSMEWKTDIMVREGDKVYFSAAAILSSLGKLGSDLDDVDDAKWINVDGELYVFIYYSQIFAAKSLTAINPEDNDIINYSKKLGSNLINDDGKIYEINCLNGYCLIEPTDEIYEDSFLITPESSKRKSASIGIVKYTGPRNEAYIELKKGVGKTIVDRDVVDINNGDKIVFNRFADIPLEYSLYKSFDESESLFRIQRKNIIAVIKDNNIIPVTDNILVELHEQEGLVRKNGIVIPGNAKIKYKPCKVIRVGSGTSTIEMKINVGQYVLIDPKGAIEVKEEGGSYLLIRQSKVVLCGEDRDDLIN